MVVLTTLALAALALTLALALSDRILEYAMLLRALLGTMAIIQAYGALVSEGTVLSRAGLRLECEAQLPTLPIGRVIAA
jgi:hypothetical protein